MSLEDVRNYAFDLAIGFAGEKRANPTSKRSKRRGIINILMAQEM